MQILTKCVKARLLTCYHHPNPSMSVILRIIYMSFILRIILFFIYIYIKKKKQRTRTVSLAFEGSYGKLHINSNSYVHVARIGEPQAAGA